jgi:hypothetical protein
LFHVSWSTFNGRDSFAAATAKETFKEIVSRGLYVPRAAGLKIKDPGGVGLCLQELQDLAMAQAVAEQPPAWKG